MILINIFFYTDYKNNISIKFYDEDGFVINGPKILWDDMLLVKDFESGFQVLRAYGVVEMNESDLNRIRPFGNLDFY